MIEMIRDPLTHIIRNAVDHGIETPAERLKAGKREIGLLSVSARQSGNQILIDIHDDGRGIDGKKLVEKAIADGVIEQGRRGAAVAARAARADLRGGPVDRQAKSPPFPAAASAWTSSAPTSSGSAASSRSTARPAKGTRMTLRVPLTLTIIPALTVSIGGQHFAIPRSAIEEIVRANGESRHARAGRRGRRRDHPRPPRARSVARRRPRPRKRRSTDEERTPDRPAPGRRRRLRARGRPDPRSRRTGGQAGRAGGDGDRPLCRHDAGRRRQPDPAVRPGGPRRGRRRQARGAGARRADRRERRPPPVAARRRCCCSAASTAARRALRLAVVDRIEEVAGERDPPGRRPAAGPARRSHPAACGRRIATSSAGQGPPVPAQRWRARDRLCLRRSHRLRGDRQ